MNDIGQYFKDTFGYRVEVRDTLYMLELADQSWVRIAKVGTHGTTAIASALKCVIGGQRCHELASAMVEKYETDTITGIVAEFEDKPISGIHAEVV